MANTTLTADIVAKEAVMILENELVMAKKVFRGYENEFDKKVNGYEVGETISIRRPTDFTVRTNATMSVQDVTEGKTTLTVDQRRGVDFEFTSQDLTLNIGQLSERVIKPAMVQLANSVDSYLTGLYKDIPNWVGTPGQVINSFADFYAGKERLMEMAVPTDSLASVLSPQDEAGMLGSQTSLFIQNAAKDAYRSGRLGMIGGVDTYMSQNIQTHTVGAHGGTPLVDGANQNVTYASVKDTNSQTLITDGWTASAGLKKGDVFTIDGVYAVNPVTKATLPFLKQFVITADVTTNASSAADTNLTISPAIVSSGAFQNVSAAPADNAPITMLGTASTSYRQNLMFHKNAFALAMVPLVAPPGAVDVSRQSYKGVNVRIIPVYDGTNDKSAWRCDILFGAKTIDERLATRHSGAA